MESTINLCRLRSPEAALTTGDDPPPIWLAELHVRGPHLLGKFLSEMAQHGQHDRFRSSRSSRSSRSFQSLSGGYWNIWNTLLFSRNITYFALQWRSFPGEACSWNPERTNADNAFLCCKIPIFWFNPTVFMNLWCPIYSSQVSFVKSHVFRSYALVESSLRSPAVPFTCFGLSNGLEHHFAD